jgi:hypothetical protein
MMEKNKRRGEDTAPYLPHSEADIPRRSRSVKAFRLVSLVAVRPVLPLRLVQPIEAAWQSESVSDDEIAA